MGVEEDVKRFQRWALSLGFSAHKIPPKNVLMRVFSTGQALAFEEVMRRVRPKEEIQRIRDTIAIKQFEQLSGTKIASKQKVPEQLQLWQKKKKLVEEMSQTESRIEMKKEKIQESLTLLQEKNIQKMQLKEQIAEVLAKNSIYELKKLEIEQQQAEEDEIAAKIDQVIPVKFDLANSNVEKAESALAAAAAECQRFYAIYDQNKTYEENTFAREQLLTNLRKHLANIPNIVLWNCLSKQMEQKVLLVEALAKNDLTNALHSISADDKKINLTKLYAKHVRLYLQRRRVNEQNDRLTKDYIEAYGNFLDYIRSKFMLYNNCQIEDDDLHDFLVVFSGIWYEKGEIEFLTRLVAENDAEIHRRRQINEDERKINDELRQAYQDIASTYFRIKEDLKALVNVKDKIIHSKNCMQYLLQSNNTDNNNQTVLGTMRMNKSANSSLNTSTSSVFRSTMSDSFENTVKSDGAFVRPQPVVRAANYTNEIKMFGKTSINLFKKQNLLQYELAFGSNPIIKVDTFNLLPSKVKTLFSDYLITPRASLERLAYNIKWQISMKDSPPFPTSNVEFPTVDEVELAARKRKQDEEIAELGDKTKAICSSVDRTVANIHDYMNLYKNNPLAKFIPHLKLVNGTTYREYEREYMMYYKMVRDD